MVGLNNHSQVHNYALLQQRGGVPRSPTRRSQHTAQQAHHAQHGPWPWACTRKCTAAVLIMLLASALAGFWLGVAWAVVGPGAQTAGTDVADASSQLSGFIFAAQTAALTVRETGMAGSPAASQPSRAVTGVLAAGAAAEGVAGAVGTGIPRMLHQSWKDSNLTGNFSRWAGSWRANHPDWDYRLWTDEDNRQLVVDEFPWLLNIYDRLPAAIMRADTARYLYLYRYGGVYVDLDFVSLRPMGPLLSSATPGTPVLAYMGDDVSFPHAIPNAWLASPPRHPLWMHAVSGIINALLSHRSTDASMGTTVESLTGPVMLTRVVADYRASYGANSVTLLGSESIYPYNWANHTQLEEALCDARSPEFDESACISLYPDAHAATFWTSSWKQG